MTPETVERVISEVRGALGSVTKNQDAIIEAVRRYALGGDLTPAEIAALSYQVGYFICANGGHLPSHLHEANLLMGLINLRSPNASVAEKQAAKIVYPTVWDLL